ncbi:DUF547 domain-containing protein [Kordiimonas lipolytica]|uniref:DUF547 domain-containing protein n=1 Tax=Kordiimonas lipolytica TaxID=1662421 RepID=A0ABV8UD46_9PROT|nr:DUF547 domain-containing protein [Kordiimonas lipolytica]
MNIIKGACAAITGAILTVSISATASEPLLPTAYNPNSQTALKYEDMDYLLEKTVLPLGRSDHKPARRVWPGSGTGTRFVRDNPEPSRLEGNRIMFHDIKTSEQEFVVREVRDVLLDLPEKIDLTRLNKNEQLAYWLNLHNAIVYAKIADRYPVTLVDRLYGDCTDPDHEDRFYCDRQFDVMGTMVSPYDIRQHVLDNWDDPVVIYGFFLGSVGSPNLRTKAYTGETVYADLEDNARDFVNSIRGTRIKDDYILRVSTYYRDVAQKFPNFERDLLAHINKYARRDFGFLLGPVTSIEVKLEDWHIADLYNGYLSAANGGANFQSVGRNGRNLDVSMYPPHVQRLLVDVVRRNMNRAGNVSIQQVKLDPKAAPETEMDEEIEVAPTKAEDGEPDGR